MKFNKFVLVSLLMFVGVESAVAACKQVYNINGRYFVVNLPPQVCSP